MDESEYQRMDAVEARMWWYRALHARLLRMLAPVRGRVLDAGCGTGGFLALLRARRPDLVCFGLEWAMPAARRAAQKSGATLVRGSVNMLPFAAGSLDAAVLADVLCHAAAEPQRALAELHRVLRPGGLLVVNMPAFAWLCSAHDRHVRNVRRQTARETAQMLGGAGFAGVQAQYWNSLLLPMMIVQRKILGRRQKNSDVAAFPPWLDAMLYSVTELERGLPSLPAGGSVLATAERT